MERFEDREIYFVATKSRCWFILN